MSKTEEKLKKLERKIDQLSEQLHTTRGVIVDANKVVLDTVADFHKVTAKLSKEMALISQASRTVKGELERRSERRMFYRGMGAGLLLGIIGNLFVSSWMEFIKGVRADIPLWVWALATVVNFLVVLWLTWLFSKWRH